MRVLRDPFASLHKQSCGSWSHWAYRGPGPLKRSGWRDGPDCTRNRHSARKHFVCRAIRLTEYEHELMQQNKLQTIPKIYMQKWAEDRGLTTTGLKGDLRQRLLQHIEGHGLEKMVPERWQGPSTQAAADQTREGQDTLPRARQNRYTRDGLLQLENAELQQILVDMEVPVGTKRTRDVMLDRILDAQGQDSVARSHSALRLDPDEQDMFDASPSLQSHADSVSHPAGDTSTGQFLLWLCDQIEGDDQPSPAWLIGPDIAQWTMGELRQELLARSLPVHGAKLTLVERLQAIREVEKRSADELLSPRKRQLMDALEERGLALHGTWPHLAQRLRQAVLQELGAAGPAGEEEEEEEPEPHVDPSEPVTSVALLMCAAAGADLALALDWARTMLDHLHTAPYHLPGGTHDYGLAVHVYYINEAAEALRISPADIYGSTEADFGINISRAAQPLQGIEELVSHLKSTADLVLPMNLGTTGITSILQSLLEAADVPFIGPTAEALALTQHKHRCAERLTELGYPVVPMLSLQAGELPEDPQEPNPWFERLRHWAQSHGLSPAHSRFVVKPAIGSCAQDVQDVRGTDMVVTLALAMLRQGLVGQEVLVEPFVNAMEVSVTVLETAHGPVALLPTEIELWEMDEVLTKSDLDLQHHVDRNEGWSEDQAGAMQQLAEAEVRALNQDISLFDQRKRYGPTGQVRLHSPPRLDKNLVHALRAAAVRVFQDLELRDYARIDVWIAPDVPPINTMTEEDQNVILDLEQMDYLQPWNFLAGNDENLRSNGLTTLTPDELCREAGGVISIADVNPLCSLERNSLVFVQAARSGLTHEHVLQHIVSTARARASLPEMPSETPRTDSTVLLPGIARQPHLYQSPEGMPEAPDAWEPAGWREYFAPGNAPPNYGRDPHQIDQEGTLEHDAEESEERSPLTQLGTSYWDEEPAQTSLTSGPGFVTYDTDAEAQEGHPQRVWVLAGGGSVERHTSLAAGINVWHQLRKQRDIRAELFVLTPLGPRSAEPARRKRLVDKRNDIIKISNNLAHPVDPELTLEEIQNPDLPPVEMLDQEVWAVPYEHTLQYYAEDLQQECEEALRLSSQLPRNLLPLERAALQARRSVAGELAAAGLPGVASTWGGDWKQPPLAPQLLSVVDFAEWAAESNAVVFISVAGSIVRNGQLQGLLTSARVAYTGSQTIETQICANKVLVADALADLEPQNILMPPRHVVELPELLTAGETEEEAQELYTRMCDAVGGPMLCIKPAVESNGTGVVRIGSQEHLQLLGATLAQRPLLIPGQLFSEDHPPVHMRPGAPPRWFVVEPFVATDSVSVSWPDVPEQTTQSAEELEANMDADADFIARLPDLPVYEDLKAAAAARQAAKPEQQKGSGQDSDDAQQAADAAPALDALGSTAHDSAAPADAVDAAEEQEEAAELLPSSVTPVQIDWVPGGARWAEVSIGLLCGGDETHALPFSLRLRGPDDFNMALSDAVGQPGPALTPVPPTLVAPEVELGVRQRAEWAARHLNLRGLVRMDALMHVDAADLLVLSIDPCPSLGPSSLLFRQALALNPPMYPGVLFREMVLGALVAQPYEQEAAEDETDTAAEVKESSVSAVANASKSSRMVAPKRYRGDWERIGKEMYDTYGPPEKYGGLEGS